MLILEIALGVALGICLFYYRQQVWRGLKSMARYALAFAVINLAIYVTWDWPDWKRWVGMIGFVIISMLAGMLYDEWKAGRIISRP